MTEPQKTGSRFLYEPFDAANARIDTQEKVQAERWSGLERRLEMIESSLERLERRLWLALYGVVGFVMIRAISVVLDLAGG
ncbi:MAG: GTA head formation protein, RCAP_rcc01685 family [Candidatus Halichondribacter symbioticus]